MLKVFTWGYAGWGNSSKHFVRAADSVERARGFRPPIFVDLRAARTVRAANFQGNTFAAIVGNHRYRWMRRLGNQRILSKRGKRIQIIDPNAAGELFDFVVAQSKKHRRIIMFCSCLEPLLEAGDGLPSCHRVVVASLLLKVAHERKRRIEIVEWPGKTPVLVRETASPIQTKALERRAKFIPLSPASGRVPAIATLGWGSVVKFVEGKQQWGVATGPAYVRKGLWQLPLIDDVVSGPNAVREARASSEALLAQGYGPRRTKL